MGFTDLPNELLHRLLFYVSPEDNLRHFHTLSRRLDRLANYPLLWRYYCRHSFDCWSSRHDIQNKFSGAASDVDWKALFLERKRIDARLSRLFEGLLRTKVERIRRCEEICTQGDDARDFLLRQSRVGDDVEDALARRYWAITLTESLNRGAALEQWATLIGTSVAGQRPPPPRSLERVLGAFDMFFFRERPLGLQQISDRLDSLAEAFQKTQPDMDTLSTRQKATALNQWLRDENLVGLDAPDTNYRNLRNCLLGHALFDPDHPSLPLASVAIFCAVAERLGLDAHCCMFPSHVHAIILAPAGLTLDGQALSPQVDAASTTSHPHNPEEAAVVRDRMYLDPYGSSAEVDLQSLEATLRLYGWAGPGSGRFLVPSSLDQVVARLSQNMLASTQTANVLARRGEDARRAAVMDLWGRPDDGSHFVTVRYAVAWSQVLSVGGAGNQEGDADGGRQGEWALRRTQHIIMATVINHVPEDTWLAQRYLVDAGAALTPPPEAALLASFQQLREQDRRVGARDQPSSVPEVALPSAIQVPDPTSRCRVGEVVWNARTQCFVVVVGWEMLAWHEEPLFYNIVCPHRPEVERVRADRVERRPVLDGMFDPTAFLQLGRYFKRMERTADGQPYFVSNIKEHFPDD